MNKIKKQTVVFSVAAFALTAAVAFAQTLTSVSINPSSVSLTVGSTTQFTASLFDENGAAYSATTTITWSSDDTSVATLDSNGLLTAVSAGTSTVSIFADDSTSAVSSTADVTVSEVSSTPTSTATIYIRDGSVLLGPYTANLPDSSTSTVEISPTGSTTTYPVAEGSVLAILSSLDVSHSEFDITDLQYFSSFSSFLVNCVYVPSASASPDCYNWTYAVNGVFPSFGMDYYNLQNGDVVYVFFGSSWNVLTDKSSVSTGESFTVTAQKYDASSGSYVPATGTTVGAVQFDAFFNATEFATSTTDSGGQAQLALNATGTYSVGIKDSGYFPNVTVDVSPASSGTSSSETGGGGGALWIIHQTIDVNKAVQFLLSKQLADGSFGQLLYTDWAAIALAASGGPTEKISSYLKSADVSGFSSATDYERHAMALMALGINPYNGASTDFIQKIVDKFDGAQIGDVSLVNDDIFSLFPLINAGYSKNDEMIQKIISFILGKQKSDGSWEGSVDLTAAAIQALSVFVGSNGVSEALTKAQSYLSSHQNSDGGFGSSYSTSWAIQAILSINGSPTAWLQNNKNPNDYLFSLQADDGGIESTSTDTNSRIWATSYAIPAVLGKTWYAVLKQFPKPSSANSVAGGGTGGYSAANSTSTASSSLSEISAQNESSSAKTSAASSSPISEISSPSFSTTTASSSKAKVIAKKNAEKTKTPALKLAEESNSSTLAASGALGPKKGKNTSALANVSSLGGKILGFVAGAVSSFFSGLFSVFGLVR